VTIKSFLYLKQKRSRISRDCKKYVLLQNLQENLTLWTSDTQNDGEEPVLEKSDYFETEEQFHPIFSNGVVSFSYLYFVDFSLFQFNSS